MFQPSSGFLTERSKAVLLFWRFFFFVLSVSGSLVVTCWERAALLVLVYVMFSCVLSLSHKVLWVRCGNFLYRFLIVAFFLTLL